MSRITYKGDPRFYKRYKIGGRYHVKCMETKIVDGISFICKYENKREDKHKEHIKNGKLH